MHSETRSVDILELKAFCDKNKVLFAEPEPVIAYMLCSEGLTDFAVRNVRCSAKVKKGEVSVIYEYHLDIED